MNRSFSNRIFGGVCGGLANTIPINAWLWRSLFIILTLATGGAAAAAYILLWWMLPLDSPLRRNTGGGLIGLLGFLLSIALIALWFLRDTPGIAANYYLITAFALAIVFFLKQIFTQHWQNILLGLIVLAVPLLFLLRNLELLPAGMADIALRSWPAILIFLGLSIVLRYRVPFGSVLALIISLGLVGGLSYYAFNSRVDSPANNQRIVLAIPNEDEHQLAEMSASVNLLAIDINTRDTDVTISVAEDDTRVIRGEFVGSQNNEIASQYKEDGSIASMSINELALSEFPGLEDMGRGGLTVRIPGDIAVGITFRGQRAQALSFDLAALNLEQLIFQVDEGNVLVVLPEYKALSPSVQESNGHWQVMNGDLRVQVPDTVGARFLLERGVNREPRAGQTFDDLLYRVELEGNDYILVARQFDSQEIKVNYRIDVPAGSLRIERGG
jgi:phage shock protein PspC (stress-responsive transcriptional regulator)